MATPAATSAVIRAYRPTFRTDHDKLAFAVHGVLCVAGCRLLAVGPQAESSDPAVRSNPEEAAITGWDASASPEQGGHYAFMYALPASTDAPAAQASTQVLLVKAVAMGDQLLVSLVADPAPEGQAPETLELQLDRFCGAQGAEKGAYVYDHLDELVQLVQGALDKQVPALRRAGGAPGPAAPAATTAVPTGDKRRDEAGFDPLRDYSQPARGPGPGYGAPYQGDPLSVGQGDRMPGGVPMPGRRPEFGPLGGPGGGMHVGPGHPVFGGGGMYPLTWALHPGLGLVEQGALGLDLACAGTPSTPRACQATGQATLHLGALAEVVGVVCILTSSSQERDEARTGTTCLAELTMQREAFKATQPSKLGGFQVLWGDGEAVDALGFCIHWIHSSLTTVEMEVGVM